ncbi:hypothetical protein Agub_g13252 [Astrephomene gubernaculifera]|uniref:Uncharacterized protein n=1 Tax=Astrephomene gubernaculifera TaxID=47775 RepID=A0AAD3HS72_9CHLO|nr:hypothetical protein Agub_g13252 [Astrephomene gubernaculifera]
MDPGSAGSSTTVDVHGLDADTALRGLDTGDMPVAAGAPCPSGDEGPALEGCASSGTLPEDAAEAAESMPSEGSSDSEVIHIDLTKRPPPLPMSGLALEQVVSMLPGNTYAVSGSGIPIREAPASEDPGSPRPRTSPKATPAAEAPAASSASDPAADAAAESPAAGVNPSPAGPEGPAGAAAQPGGGEDTDGPCDGSSPRVAFTFIPGLGVVPVVVHADILEDEDSDEERDGEGGGSSGGAAGLHKDVEVEPRNAPGPETAGPVQQTAAGDPPAGAVAVDGAAAEPAVVVPKMDISEEQLRSIIQQAVDGMTFGDAALVGGDEPDEDQAEDEEEQQEKEQPPPQLPPVQQQLPSTGSVPVFGGSFAAEAAAAGGFGGAEEAVGPTLPQPMAGFTALGGQAVDEPECQLQGLQSGFFGDRTAESVDGGSEGDASGPGEDGEQEEGEGEEAYEEEGQQQVAGEDSYMRDEEDEADVEEEEEGDIYEEDNIIPGDMDSDAYTDEDEGDTDAGVGGQEQLPAAAAGASAPSASPATATTAATTDAGAGASTASLQQSPSVGASAALESALPPVKVFGQGQSGRGIALSLPSLPRSRYAALDRSPSHGAASGSGAADTSHDAADGAARGEEHRAPGKSGLATELGAALRSVASGPAPGLTPRPSANFAAGASLPTPFAGCVLGTGGGGGGGSGSDGIDLNATIRLSGQSLTAIRQAALQAEAHRQAQAMAEGDAGKAAGDNAGGAHPHHTTSASPRRAGVPNLLNPFGMANRQASAAAGLTNAEPKQGASTSGSSFPEGDSAGGLGHDAEDAGDLLRDRSIIPPRYPTDAQRKQQQQHHHHHSHHERSEEGSAALSQSIEGHEAREGAEPAPGGKQRTRHRRSAEHIDLNAIAPGDAPEQADGRNDAGDENLHPPCRSLLAMRRSEEELPTAPAVSDSPRMLDEYYEEGSSSSSSAKSVADERLMDELEALREELGQKTTLVAGLRGELRKFSELAVRLEHQLGELRAQNSSQGAAAPRRASASAGPDIPAATVTAAPSVTSETQQDEQQQQQQHEEQQSSSSPAASSTSPPASSSSAASHSPLPPHPQPHGLEGGARLALYREIVSQAQLHAGRASGPAPADLRDAQELLQGKETLDAGTEKVMLIKLHKLVSWGCEAAWKASVAQQQLRHSEEAAQRSAQQAAQARSAWEAEREQLRRALEQRPSGPAAAAAADASGDMAAANEGLRQQVQTSQGELAVARARIAELEAAMEALKTAAGKPHQTRLPRSSPEGVTSDVDSAAWGKERQMLLKTISALQQEAEQARAAAGSSGSADAGSSVTAADADAAATSGVAPSASPAPAAAAMEAAAPAAAAMEAAAPAAAAMEAAAPASDAAAAPAPSDAAAAPQPISELQAERDAAVAEAADLRRQLDELLARAEEGRAHDAAVIEDLHLDLEEARAALQQQSAEAETQAQEQEQQCSELLAHVEELQQELAAAEARHEEERRAARAKQVAALATRDAEIQDLREQLKAAMDDLEEARAQGGTPREPHDPAQALEAKTQELAAVEAQLADVRGALTELQAEGGALQQRVVELQALLRRVQQQKEDAEADAVAARAEAATAQVRAGDADTALELAEAALGRARAQLDALQSQVMELEDEAVAAREEARSTRQGAEAALEVARKDAEELRASVARLEAEVRELREAADSVHELRSQVEGLEGELEAQAMRATVLGQHAEDAESALAAAVGKVAELEAAAADAAGARAEAAELRTKVLEFKQRLEDAAQRLEQQQQQEMGNDAARADRLQALQEELRAAQSERDAYKRDLAECRKQLEAARQQQQQQANAVSPSQSPRSVERREMQGDSTAAQIAALRREKAQLLAECARLQNEVERERANIGQFRAAASTSDGGLSQTSIEASSSISAAASEAARVKEVEQQLLAANAELEVTRAELQAARGELQTAGIELALKRELLAAKERSLVSLQETVDALKVAVMATQQMPGPTYESTRAEAQSRAEGLAEARQEAAVEVLQRQLADSERTARRLEQQVAMLEVRLSDAEESSARAAEQQAASQASSERGDRDVLDLLLQLQSKDAEVADLRREVELLRQQLADSSARLASAGAAHDPANLSAATIHELQLQLLQWRSLGEDLHARYQAKKEALRQLKEQLAAEQQRHADEQARNQARLEAACQRLGRLSADLGLALRRCITLDLQPLSAASLTSSPRAHMAAGGAGGDAPADVNALAALLARQGAALIESLETALEQAASAREERASMSTQLSSRQAVLDDLRHQLVRQAGARSVPGDMSGALAAARLANMGFGAGSGTGGHGVSGMRLGGDAAGGSSSSSGQLGGGVGEAALLSPRYGAANNVRPPAGAPEFRQTASRVGSTVGSTIPVLDATGVARAPAGGAPGSSLLGLNYGSRAAETPGLVSSSSVGRVNHQAPGSVYQQQLHAAAGRATGVLQDTGGLPLHTLSPLRLGTPHDTTNVYGGAVGTSASAGAGPGPATGFASSSPSLALGALHERWSRRSGAGM